MVCYKELARGYDTNDNLNYVKLFDIETNNIIKHRFIDNHLYSIEYINLKKQRRVLYIYNGEEHVQIKNYYNLKKQLHRDNGKPAVIWYTDGEVVAEFFYTNGIHTNIQMKNI